MNFKHFGDLSILHTLWRAVAEQTPYRQGLTIIDLHVRLLVVATHVEHQATIHKRADAADRCRRRGDRLVKDCLFQ